MKSRSESITEADKNALFPIIDDLIGGWCDRRELKPLRILLRSYPLSSGLADDWQQLYESLLDLEHLQASITADERERLTYSRRIVEFILRR